MKLILTKKVQLFSAISVLIFACNSFSAQKEITIIVKVSPEINNAKALGFTVNGKSFGSLGRSTSKYRQPKGEKYFFGYKTGIIGGESIGCGSLIISKNSTVTLYSKNGKCFSVAN